MRMSPTLSLYLGRRYFAGVAATTLALLMFILLFDLIELLRRAAEREEITFAVVVAIAVLNLPILVQKVLPFAALFGGMFVFSRLTRNHELVVARAAGVSVWQFLAPAAFIAVLIGIFVVTVLNPLSAVTASRHDQLVAKYLRGQPNLLSVSPTGLWLRQVDPSGQSVIHAQSVSRQGLELTDVIIFLYQGTDRFAGRIDARSATLEAGSWQLSDVLVTSPDRPAERHESYQLPTTLTLGQIQDSFASPETLSFWALPKFIALLKESGFAALKHRLRWHSVLSTPLLLFAMVLIAATFSLRLTRRGGAGLVIAGGVLAGFVLFFLSDLVFALGLSGKIPAVLAAWSPAGVSTLLGLALLFHLEDG
jgi:lipopolysaccharide export system permease protein